MPEHDDEKEFAEFARRAFSEWKRREAEKSDRTIRELWAAWIPTLEGKGTRVAHATSSYRRYVAKMPVRLGEREFVVADLRWSEFDRDHVNAWLAALRQVKSSRNEPLSAGSRDQVRLHLQACFAYHVKETRLMRWNPLANVPREEREPKMRLAYFTPEALATFMQHARPLLQQYMRFVARTGLRRDEARLLRKDQIDHEHRELVIPRKGGKTHRVLVPDDAYQELRALILAAPGEYVFPNPRDPRGGPIPTDTLGGWFRRARKAAGITMLGEKLVIHSLRHGYAMGMMEVPGAPIHHVAQQLGHKSTQQLEERYSRLRGPAKEHYRKLAEQNPLGLDNAKKKPPDPTK